MEAAVTVLADTQGKTALRIWDGETLLHEQRVALTAGRQTFACAIEPGGRRAQRCARRWRCRATAIAGKRQPDGDDERQPRGKGSAGRRNGRAAAQQLEQLSARKAFRWP